MPHSPTLTSTPINTVSRVALHQRLLHDTDMIDNDNVTSSQILPFGYSNYALHYCVCKHANEWLCKQRIAPLTNIKCLLHY